MRGDEQHQEAMFSYVSLERRVAADHPLRKIRALVDRALERMEPVLKRMYAERGRPSIAPERLLRAQLLMALYSIRSEHQLMEQLDYNLLYRWFVGLEMDASVWSTTVFSKNRKRLIEAEASTELLLAVVEEARGHQLLSEEHFTVDGTLIQAWASRRSFKPRPEPPARGTGARGRKLLRDTHESTTDPQARLYRKSSAGAVVPSYLGHLITENRNGLIVAAMATEAGTAQERRAALGMLKGLKRQGRITLGADKSYQEERFIRALREQQVTPHVAEYRPNGKWANWLTEEERNDPGLVVSQRKRKLVEKPFGWMKQERIRQVKRRGLPRVNCLFCFMAAAHNLLRLSKLVPIPVTA
ncbi:MAG TPA: IS5 family transposase [Terriglobia bacterium]|jgi:transposase|nr:IS5 family transposase [Terriglobia bacterium]